MMFALLEIERLWGYAPGSLLERDADTIGRLLAWYRLHRERAAYESVGQSETFWARLYDGAEVDETVDPRVVDFLKSAFAG